MFSCHTVINIIISIVHLSKKMNFFASDLNQLQLPRCCDIINYLIHLRDNGIPFVPRKYKFSNYFTFVIENVRNLWKKLKIPLLAKSSIRRLLSKLVEDYKKLCKNNSEIFTHDWNKLFKISQCKCEIENNIFCSCPQINQIPVFLKEFYIDQCGPRNFLISDFEQNLETDELNSISYPISTIHSEFVPDEDDVDNDELDNEDNQLEIDSAIKTSDICLQNFSLALDRSDTSNRFGALLATTLIKDLKISLAAKANKTNSEIDKKIVSYLENLIIDKNKIQRERLKARNFIKINNKNNSLLSGLSYDGKKEDTLFKEIINNKIRIRKKTEEHITIVKEPNSEFIGYVTPLNGTSKQIQISITDFLSKEGIRTDNLVSINCDGAIVNTGHNNGVNRCMEEYIQRPLQWNVCLFHFNELPLKHLITSLYGKTKGPGVWADCFGADLCNAEKFPVRYNYLLLYLF